MSGLGGVTDDTLTVTYVVTVSDNGDGKLNVAYDIPEDVEFNNTYEAEGSVIFEFEKVLDGRTIKDKEFTFNLVDNEGHVLQTKQNDTQGIVLFDEISYNQDDVGKEFIYKVIEVLGEESGMTYDESEIVIVVTVSDLGNGYLSIEVDAPENVTFVNIYRANGEVILRGHKTLEGRVLKDQEFGFELYDSQGQLIETVKNNAQGSFEFSALAFTQDDIGKEFVYTISEIKGSEKGMTYDEAVIKVTVKVVDSHDGEFEFEIIYEEDLVFINSYTIPKDGVVTATKRWVNRDDKYPTIWFKLYRALEGKAPEEVVGAEIKELKDGLTQVTWTGLEQIDIDGNKYVFSVKEVDAQGNPLVLDYFEKEENGLVVTNTFIAKPDFTLDKTSKEDVFHKVGDTIEFVFTIVNTGNIDLINLVLIDPMLGDIVLPNTTLKVGETMVVTKKYTVTQQDVDNKKVYNKAKAEAECPPCVDLLVPREDDHEVPYKGVPKLPETGTQPMNPILPIALISAGAYLLLKKKKEED